MCRPCEDAGGGAPRLPWSRRLRRERTCSASVAAEMAPWCFSRARMSTSCGAKRRYVSGPNPLTSRSGRLPSRPRALAARGCRRCRSEMSTFSAKISDSKDGDLLHSINPARPRAQRERNLHAMAGRRFSCTYHVTSLKDAVRRHIALGRARVWHRDARHGALQETRSIPDHEPAAHDNDL